jgi:hypothetical protein
LGQQASDQFPTQKMVVTGSRKVARTVGGAENPEDPGASPIIEILPELPRPSKATAQKVAGTKWFFAPIGFSLEPPGLSGRLSPPWLLSRPRLSRVAAQKVGGTD